MPEPSGPQWCDHFPNSTDIEDLDATFRGYVRGFLASMAEGGATVKVNTTYRPPERAWLMHYCTLVAGYRTDDQVFHRLAPQDVPASPGIDIDWTHGGDAGQAVAAAVAMRNRYGIVFPPALYSRHCQRLAIDMDIHFTPPITVKTKYGQARTVKKLTDLYPVGASFGVRKLPTDEPHWSIDGH